MSLEAPKSGVPAELLPMYQRILPNNHEGITFLFSEAFSNAISVPAKQVAKQYQITAETAMEEFRRLLAIKAFTGDKYATKISPTPLSKENPLN